jgi:cell division inhibitor SepF
VAVSTLYRLKAYFGMVPAEDMDAYLDYDDEPGQYDDQHYRDRRSGYDQRSGYAESGGGHRGDHLPDRRVDHTVPRADHRAGRHQADYQHSERQYTDRDRPLTDASSGSSVATGRSPMVHGSLAVDPPSPEPTRSPALTEADRADSVSRRQLPLSRITTVHPRSYEEARMIGEQYRDGIPVIMNLTDLDDAVAKRLVDFAAGLVFALRGSFDKVTSRVFLLSPAGVEVSAEDRRRLAERGFFGQS